MITEVPFENGKVVGLWYVGNTVYTVGIYNAMYFMDEGSILLFFPKFPECCSDCQHQAGIRVPVLDMGKQLCSIPQTPFPYHTVDFFHSQIHHLTVWGSIFTWFLYVVVYSHFWPTFPIAVEMVGQEVSLYRSFTFYYLFILAPFVATLPDLLKTM